MSVIREMCQAALEYVREVPRMSELRAEKSLLIVGDVPLVTTYLQRALTRLGYLVYAAVGTHDAALKAIAERVPDVVLMDLRLKGELDGVALASALRTRIDFALIYMTGAFDQKAFDRALAGLPHIWLAKPFTLRELEFAIEHAIAAKLMEKQRA